MEILLLGLAAWAIHLLGGWRWLAMAASYSAQASRPERELALLRLKLRALKWVARQVQETERELAGEGGRR